MCGNLFSPNAFQLKMNSDRRSFLSGIQFFSIIQSDSQKLMFLQFNFDLFALLRSSCSVVSVNIRIHTFFVLFFSCFADYLPPIVLFWRGMLMMVTRELNELLCQSIQYDNGKIKSFRRIFAITSFFSSK